jgi:hypothetical protein
MSRHDERDVPAPESRNEWHALFRELLSPALTEKLAALAIRSEEGVDLAEELERSGAFLEHYAGDASELGATVLLLKSKVAALEELNARLSRQLMRHAHLLEDAAKIARGQQVVDRLPQFHADPRRS